MNVSDYFLEVAATYDRREAMSSSAQNTLKRAPELLAEHAPAGIFIQGSGGKGLATHTPWVGFFNPDETDTPQRGLYVVYLFSEDMERLVLTLNQGMEYLRRRHGNTRARALLARDAEAIRTRFLPRQWRR